MEIKKSLIKNNFSYGRGGQKISKIVMHTYGGYGTDLTGWFNQPSTQASAHYSVFKNGQIIQYVEDFNTAWHSGNGYMNLQSIGIEHQDDGDYNNPSTYTDTQYKASAELVKYLCDKYNININRSNILKHNEVIQKECPGKLDVDLIINYTQPKMYSKEILEWVKKEERTDLKGFSDTQLTGWLVNIGIQNVTAVVFLEKRTDVQKLIIDEVGFDLINWAFVQRLDKNRIPNIFTPSKHI